MSDQHDNSWHDTLILFVIGAIFGALFGWLSANTWLGFVLVAIIVLFVLLSWFTDGAMPDFVTPIFTWFWGIVLGMAGTVTQTDLSGPSSKRQRVPFGIGFGVALLLAFWLFHSVKEHAV